MTNKEKKECECLCHRERGTVPHPVGYCRCRFGEQRCEIHPDYFPNECGCSYEENRKAAETPTPDPLTSLLKSAERELKEKFSTLYRYDQDTGSEDGDEYFDVTDDIKSFLLSKLTEAFNKGKEIR